MSDAIDWTFGGTWPYTPRWFDGADGRMHYVDEGPADGRPLVMVHGNPAWSYLYRNFIGPVAAAGYRAIAFDHLGFGRSEKPGDAALYDLERHIGRAESLLESLQLEDATLLVQDWGGPVGFGWATRHPERIRSLMVLNTFAHRIAMGDKLPLPMLRLPLLGEVLIKSFDTPKAFALFRFGVVKRARLGPRERAAYLAPHRSWASRTAILEFSRQIPRGVHDRAAATLAAIEGGLPGLAGKPVSICWGMQDSVLGPELIDELWLPSFPDAEVTRITDAGHFVQEDAHEVIVPELLRLLEREPPTTTEATASDQEAEL